MNTGSVGDTGCTIRSLDLSLSCLSVVSYFGEPPERQRAGNTMNAKHLELCSSAEWAEAVEQWIVPAALRDERLGEDVLEVGPGPGLTTDVLRRSFDHVTAIEIHDDLATSLAARMANSNVEVVHADATAMPFEDDRFSGAVCLTMLHHVPTAELQDRLLAEVGRVLRPGAVFIGSDSLDSDEFRDLHVDDICVPVPPDGLHYRLVAAGFVEVEVEENPPYSVRFRANKPPA